MDSPNILALHYDALTRNLVPKLKNEDYMLKNMLQKTYISNVFFSDINVDVIQDTLIENVQKITGKRISRQSESELLIIMRSIYLQYSRNDPNNVDNEVRWLNGKVIKYCIDSIIPNMTQYIKYLSEVGSNPTPVDRGSYMSQTGTKMGPMKKPF